MKIFRFLSVSVIWLTVCLGVLGNSCMSPVSEFRQREIAGPLTEIIDLNIYKTIIYVAQRENDSEPGDGSLKNPFQTISQAFAMIEESSAQNKIAILVTEGQYPETVYMREYVDLYGGFSPGTWVRNIFRYQSVLAGGNTKRLAVGANNSVVDGFVFKGGAARGEGGAILCDAMSPRISNNIFINNKTLKPVPWNPKYWHETANDGGAVYCANGAAPEIRNNLFIRNKTENGRGAAIAADYQCNPEIRNNVFLKNLAGLDDPMRSSDGGALSIFNWSSAVVENNYFIGNSCLSSNDGGGVFIALWSSVVFRNNVLVGNSASDDAGALFVGGQEHRYDSPLDPLPPRDKFFVEIDRNVFMGNHNPSKNSGAMRFTMESRGSFRNNLVAHNTGIYFQRCEAVIENNTILNNYLHVETKEGLQKCIIRKNLIWGDFDLRVDAVVEDNNMRDIYPGSGNRSDPPQFQDGFHTFKAFTVSFSRAKMISDIYIGEKNLKNGELTGRVVRAGDQWTVVQNNTPQSISVFGDFSDEVEFILMPEYVIKK
jgi:hypothetical protein